MTKHPYVIKDVLSPEADEIQERHAKQATRGPSLWYDNTSRTTPTTTTPRYHNFTLVPSKASTARGLPLKKSTQTVCVLSASPVDKHHHGTFLVVLHPQWHYRRHLLLQLLPRGLDAGEGVKAGHDSGVLAERNKRNFRVVTQSALGTRCVKKGFGVPCPRRIEERPGSTQREGGG